MSRIVGIDLGTSTSEIAYIEDGKPVLIPNHIGEFITPSVIHIQANGEKVVGLEAREKLLLEPDVTFMEVKRLMGTDDVLRAHGIDYSPRQLSSFIIKYLVDCASAYLKEEIDRAVITVPAYFSDEQRRATIEAGKLCGLKVERIINEPTAAALCYGIDHMEDCTNILVYDLGGGTLDVTVLEMFEGVMEVRASSGNNKLGGKDFDDKIVQYIIEKFNKNNQSYIQNDVRAMSRLKKEAEACKIALSKEQEYIISLPFFANIKDKPVSVEETITRDVFESLISEQIESTREQINSALQDARMKVDELDLILLVGGSTRIPYVERFLFEVFHKEPQNLVNPDLAVVSGAAVQAGILEDAFEGNEIVLTDVCPYTLGTAVLRDGYFGFSESNIYFDPIIPRNITIPTTVEKIYQTSFEDQTRVAIKVYQGEYSDPALNNFLNEFWLSGIPAAPAGEEKIVIAFSYDVNGILQVEAKIVSTGEKASITISTNDKEMVEEVDISKWRESKNAKKYTSILRHAEKALMEEDDEELEDLIRSLKEGLIKEEPLEELDKRKEDIVEYLLDMGEDEDDDE